jgi:peptidoglycan/xylan/chitin deacetylase (PgdA/CDA1 family)
MDHQLGRPVSRRHVFGLGVAAAVAGLGVAACGNDQQDGSAAPPVTTTPRPSAPNSAAPTTTPAAPSSPAPGGPAVQVVRGSGQRQQVALTFHGAGSLSIARQIHDALGAANAKATIMAVGTWVSATPDGITMFHDDGHEVGNHTWSHGDMARMSASPTLVEIQRCRDALDSAVGTPGTFFRQSDAQYATQTELVEAGQAGYARVLSYDIDALDWQDPGPSVIRNAVAKATAGSVVSMHLGHPGTVLALPNILHDLADRGLSAVTASELLR